MQGSAEVTIAIVPARGGSKRIPRKNAREFLGTPLLARVLGVVTEVGIFDHVIVSTDDEELADIARASSATVPFMRPAELSDDHTGARPVIMHAISETERWLGARVAHACVVYPTAVFVDAADIVGSKQMLDADPNLEFVFSAVEFDSPVWRGLRKRGDGTTEPVWPQHIGARSQDLEVVFHDAGQFYWGRRDSWMDGAPVFTSRSSMYELPRWRVQDIDTPEDWTRAEIIHRLLNDG